MRSITTEQKNLISKLSKAGYSTQDIAERIGVNRETVRRYIIANGGYERDKYSTKGNRYWNDPPDSLHPENTHNRRKAGAL